MRKLTLYFTGKMKEELFIDAIATYQKRLKSTVSIELCCLKDDQALLKKFLEQPYAIALDEKGKQFDSKEFSGFLFDRWEKKGSHLAFFMGGAEGLPFKIKQTAEKISLSAMTFPHQMARLMFIEQVYRACEIDKNTPYHK